MKIAHFVESFSPLSETFIFNKVIGLDKLNFINTVYTTKVVSDHRTFHRTIQLQKKVRLVDRVKYKLISWFGEKERLKGIDIDVYLDSLYLNLKRSKPDILVCHFGPFGVKALGIAQKLGIPILSHFYGYDVSNYLRSKYWKKRYLEKLDHFDGLVAISSFVKNKLIQLGAHPDRIHLIPLGVDPKTLELARKTEGKDVTFCFVGRFVEKKSPLELIKCFCTALERKAEADRIKLVMVGDGPLLQEAKREVHINNLSDVIEFTGSLSHDKAMVKLASSDVYIQHSVIAKNGDMEGLGVTLVEASYVGLPVICTDHNGFGDVVINNQTGYLTPEHDIVAMSEKILLLARDKELRIQMGQNGRAHIMMKFLHEHEMQLTKLLFEKVIKGE